MTWHQDLAAHSLRRGFVGAVTAWFAAPGFRAVTLFRISQSCRRYGILGKATSVIVWRHLTRSTACYLSPNARIGPGLRLPHPAAIVVGEGVQLGTNVTIYQSVTLGVAKASTLDYPVVEDDVTIYAGAVVVGGIRISRGAVVAANSVVLTDVPPGAVVAGSPARQVGVLGGR